MDEGLNVIFFYTEGFKWRWCEISIGVGLELGFDVEKDHELNGAGDG